MYFLYFCVFRVIYWGIPPEIAGINTAYYTSQLTLYYRRAKEATALIQLIFIADVAVNLIRHVSAPSLLDARMMTSSASRVNGRGSRNLSPTCAARKGDKVYGNF